MCAACSCAGRMFWAWGWVPQASARWRGLVAVHQIVTCAAGRHASAAIAAPPWVPGCGGALWRIVSPTGRRPCRVAVPLPLGK
eukprot:8927054-Heterocapsa_arctica.AAC.1